MIPSPPSKRVSYLEIERVVLDMKPLDATNYLLKYVKNITHQPTSRSADWFEWFARESRFTFTEYIVFEFLFDYYRRPVTAEEILANLNRRTGKSMSKSNLYNVIKRMRTRFINDEVTVRNVYGKGYILDAGVFKKKLRPKDKDNAN
jgi:DNA-binding response OmpR family regulator